MSCLLQICLIVVFILYGIDIGNSKPIFQGFSIQKGFEFNLKPFQFKPISFFKEKWSPFGRFGVRKGIQKRDLVAVSGERLPPPPLVSPAPVFEHIEEIKTEERKQNIETPSTELRLGPDPVKPLTSNFIRVPLTENFKPPTEGLYTSIGRNPPANNFILEKPSRLALEEMYQELPQRPVGPIPVQPAGPILAQPAGPFLAQPAGPILAQPAGPIPAKPVNFIPVQASIPKEVIPLLRPPPSPPAAVAPIVPFSEIPPTDGPLVRGSKLALYFSNVLLQLVSQFLTNARLQFSQFPTQQAQPPVPVPISN